MGTFGADVKITERTAVYSGSRAGGVVVVGGVANGSGGGGASVGGGTISNPLLT